MKRINIFILFLFSICFCAFSNAKVETPKTESSLSFKENKGQIGDQFSKPRPDILFAGNTGNMDFYLRNNGISYQMVRVDKWKQVEDRAVKNSHPKTFNKVPEQTTIYRLDINWLNANLNSTVLKESTIEGYDNYYSEVCPNGVTGVKSYKNVTYQNLFNGIDLKWYEKNGDLKYDYIVAPGVDHKQIQLEIKGAETVFVDKNGELIIKTPLGELTEAAPYVTQNGKQLAAKWIVKGSLISFDIKNIDSSLPLIIDPLIRFWGTYYGGNDDDAFYGSAVDASGNVYASGYSYSLNNIATSGAYQTVLLNPANEDAVMVKFNSTGVRLWGTYYGGNGFDYSNKCAVDATGNYVAMIGTTSTTLAGVIATPGSHQTGYGGTGSNQSYIGDAFLVLFNNAGVRQWGTYYGGYAGEWGSSCTIDNTGDIYIAGASQSSVGIASPGSHQPAYGGLSDAFLAKFNNAGTRLWATYYGDVKWEAADICKVDPFNNVFITGYTESTANISTPGALQPNLVGPYGYGDALIVKFNSAGVRQWGTYYGDVGRDRSYNCVFDATGNIYVAGYTTPGAPNTLPVSTPGAHQTTFGGGVYDAFLLKLTPGGSRLWCTLYGGKGDEEFNYCAIDPAGNIYLTGTTTSTNAISTSCSWQTNYSGVKIDNYIAKFDPTGTRLWGTYYGGTGSEYYCTNLVDPSGNLYLVGTTSTATGTVMASPGSHQAVYGGGESDGFVTKFDGCIPNAINATDPSSLTICKGDSTVLTVVGPCGIKWFDAPVGGSQIGNNPFFTTPNLTTTTTFYVNESGCGVTSSLTPITVTVNTPITVSVNLPSVMLCAKSSVNLMASGATSYTWSPETSISCILCSDPIVSPDHTIEYCVVGSNDNVCYAKACTTVEVNLVNGIEFSFPTAFTPNGDGNNDSFCLQGWDHCNDDFHIMIFDRWGEKVFESTDPNFCWNGIYKGQLLNADVFVYSVTAKYKDDTEVSKKGNITLIR